MKKSTVVLFWIIAVLMTLGASVYQRMSGPTNPKRTTISINNQEYKLKLPRSGGTKDCEVSLNIDKNSKAKLFYKKYPSSDEFAELDFIPKYGKMIAYLPLQPPAGKLSYYIQVDDKAICKEEPLIIRFKGDVPSWVLIPHIILMFVAMLFANYGLILTIANKPHFKRYLYLTISTLIAGGFIFGPLVQKFAFGVYWSGFPFGYDLTDNKTLIALVALLLVIPVIKKKYSRWAAMIAFVVMISIFSIPHSLRGSELNHQTGKLESGR